MVSEVDGCAILRRVFEGRGYHIDRDVGLTLGPVSFSADGWDPGARVGFEYMTHEAGDHQDLTPPKIDALAAMMERGELFIFIIDEARIERAEELEWAANAFLDEVTRRRAASDEALP